MEGSMLEVKIEKILPITEIRDSLNKIVDEVEGTDELYVLTKNGKPAAVIAGVQHLEKLTGTSHEALLKDVEEDKPAEEQPTSLGEKNSAPTAPIWGGTDKPEESTPSKSEPTPPTAQASDTITSSESPNGATASPLGDTEGTAEDDIFSAPSDDFGLGDTTPAATPSQTVATNPEPAAPSVAPPASNTGSSFQVPDTADMNAPQPATPADQSNTAATPPAGQM